MTSMEQMGGAVDRTTVRAAQRGIESTFAAGVTHPAVRSALAEFDSRLDDVGLVNLVTRSAPMGPVPAEVVRATFFNLNPEVIHSVIPEIWSIAPPERLLAAQNDAFAPALAAAVASMDTDELSELATLSHAVASAAAEHTEGLALFAGVASLPWPSRHELVTWHAAKLLREHRGDGHLATLTIHRLTGVDALVVHAAFDGYPPDALRLSRRWSQEAWDESVERLRERGWLTDDALPTLTDTGRERRQWMEDRTDEFAAEPYLRIGQEGVERMTLLGRRLTRVLGDADIIPPHYRLPPRERSTSLRQRRGDGDADASSTRSSSLSTFPVALTGS